MTVEVNLPEELLAQIDTVADDRNQFIVEAVRRVLRKPKRTDDEEVALINSVADELNAEAADALEYQAPW